MIQRLPLLAKLGILAGTLSALTYALSQENGKGRAFTDMLRTYLEERTGRPVPPVIQEGGKGGIDSLFPVDPNAPLAYHAGDWHRYIIEPKYTLLYESMDEGRLVLEERDDVDINSYGAAKWNLLRGKSAFTSRKYKLFDTDEPVSRVIQSGTTVESEMQLHMEGRVGDRLTVYIDHDSRRQNNENQYRMQYKAVRDDEVIREINAGDISIKLNNSKYAVYDETSTSGLGIDTTVRKGNLTVKAFGSVTRGETEVEYFRGNSASGNLTLAEYQYIRNTYFQIEAFKRYDNLSAPPGAPYVTRTFTSAPASFTPYQVNIDAQGFELYVDDQNPLNNLNAITLAIDDGKYTKMVSGADYTINFATGLVTFLKTVPAGARIFAVYTLNGGSTSSSDPAKRSDAQFPGKIFVFIKYGYSIDEDADRNGLSDGDKNGDGVMNLDIYEVRSFYHVGEQQLLQNNFSLKFFERTRLLTKTETGDLGSYTVDYTRGIIGFSLREPFRSGLSLSVAAAIYSEIQASNIADVSAFRMRVDYYREARSFQLKHFNIIPDSVRVKVDGREIPASLYTLDLTSGYFAFVNQNNPVISPETAIEIRYEFLPFAAEAQSFVGGARADYRLSRDLLVGGTMLFTRSAGGGVIPVVGSEPTQTLVLEGDMSLFLSEQRMKELVNLFPGVHVDSSPVDVKAYAEYARSYRNVNTFGKGLIDDMESADEVVSISLSEKDWILSSMPNPLAQNLRGLLLYKFYREPSSPDRLQGTGFTPYTIPYSVKPGPYNVATGHVADSIQKAETQRSLVLDFDLGSSGTTVPIVTRNLSSDAVDFSGLQYVEIWYRAGSGAEALESPVNLFLDLGSINEDADGDGSLDTEDLNANGFLDYDPTRSQTEDRGYRFNPSGGTDTVIGSGPGLSDSTRGDGILNSEDLNGNGTLDAAESIVRLQGAILKGASATPITVAPGDTAWQMARLYIERSSTAFTDNISLLKQVRSIRLFLAGSAPNAGRIYIDSMRFVSSRWRNIKINGTSDEDPDRFSVTMVDSINDPEYRSNSFLSKKSDVYQELHGEKTNRELEIEQETAMQIDYNLPGTFTGSVSRKFAKEMDLRFYKTLSLWLNCRSTLPYKIGVRVGSSENDYYAYEFIPDFPDIWREVKLNLKSGANGIDRISATGHPDLKRVSYMEIIIDSGSTGGAGKIWVNDIYSGDAETLVDSAYWYEGEIRGKRPLFKTAAGVPILSDLEIKVIEKGHGAQFSSVGKTQSDVMERYREIFSSVKILPAWSARLDYITEDSRTDSQNENVSVQKRGKSGRSSLSIESDFAPSATAVPGVKLVYKNDRYRNSHSDYLSADIFREDSEEDVQNPVVIVRENLDDFLGGKLLASLLVDTSFKQESVTRGSPTLPKNILNQSVPVSEREKRQSSSAELTADYQGSHVYVQPAITVYSQEIVDIRGRSSYTDTGVQGDMEGDFHIPFLYGSDYRFVERNKKGALNLGLKGIGAVSPSWKGEMVYFENQFRDYDDNERLLSGRYRRDKDARSFVSSAWNLPFDFSASKNLDFISSMNFGYTRSLQFREEGIPYEGEGASSFSERYGINRTFDGIAGEAFNMAKYPPWYFMTGRGNYARGRDFTYARFNNPLTFSDGESAQDYDNGLRLIDNFSLNSTLNFQRWTLALASGLNQVSERQAVEGVPQQVITFTSNADLSFDLMRFFSFWFFRPNLPGIPFHAVTLSLGYDYSRNMIITSNVREDVHTPELGIVFKRDRASLGLKAGVDLRNRQREEYIDQGGGNDPRDDVYLDNMQKNPYFREIDRGYRFSAIFETDVHWIHEYFSAFYTLTGFPIFSIEYSMLLNRYDYIRTVSPEPYDQHLVTGKLTLDLHKNVQGGLVGRWALEKFRNRETGNVYREIMSYELGMNFSLVF
ncbi:MAG: hypothetical protein EPN93_03725 [Spirochaetes bacterium]|nr:MAG: hypothetical protein EPN93_03725 [Spirochaetota bacterium]